MVLQFDRTVCYCMVRVTLRTQLAASVSFVSKKQFSIEIYSISPDILFLSVCTHQDFLLLFVIKMDRTQEARDRTTPYCRRQQTTMSSMVAFDVETGDTHGPYVGRLGAIKEDRINTQGASYRSKSRTGRPPTGRVSSPRNDGATI